MVFTLGQYKERSKNHFYDFLNNDSSSVTYYNNTVHDFKTESKELRSK